ncbi:MAG: prepilin-type N-terminal cleavage/methylation domain-containing protein [Opitutales bacterium]|nr:prepilin-type N-terminal cleavage/methylation domain-containing protein [Verrucomicrobiota bacterium]MBQ2732124.1 prepilin-type N-terminal cleavage/methylation domain-containing protein [Opitutales bacterium]
MKKRGFTLIEILVVIAIIGLLAAIMIPVAGGAKDALTKTKSKARFNEWVTAVEQYKMTYGFYPTLGQNTPSGSDAHFNLANGSNSEAFVKSLYGKDPETGDKLTGSERTKYNRKATTFCEFSGEDFTQASGEVEFGKLVDGFGNNNIHIVMDTTGNGRVEIPQQYLPSDATEDESNEKGMLGRVIIFTSEKDGEDYESVYSWR